MKKTKRVLLWVAAFSAGFAMTAASAFADTLDDAVQAVGEYIAAGNYTEAAIVVVIGLVATFRKFAPKQWGFWRGDIGGSLLVLIVSFGAALAAAMKGGDGFEWGMLWTALKLAAFTSGGYTLVKRLGGAAIAKLPIPGWAQRVLSAALWLFKPGGTAAVAKAEKAGDAAVDANPVPGVGKTGTLK